MAVYETVLIIIMIADELPLADPSDDCYLQFTAFGRVFKDECERRGLENITLIILLPRLVTYQTCRSPRMWNGLY